jgi:PAS domain S-box-containing protein
MDVRILVAEERTSVAMQLEHRLRSLGFVVCGLAATTAEAVERARATRPDLLLFDVGSRGGLDGVEAARAIRAERRVPVIFSAAPDEASGVPVPPLDGSKYLATTNDDRTLRLTIEAALHDHRLAEERDRVARERRRAEARLTAIVDRTPDAIVSMDHDGRILMFSRGAERVFDRPADEAIGTPVSTLLGPTCKACGTCEMPSDDGADTVWRDVVAHRRSGEPFAAEAACFRTATEGERLYSFILRDVTERRRLEQRTLHAQKLEAVGRLAAGVAHDFNNLLSAIHCNAYLARVQSSSASRGAIDHVLEDVQRGAALIRQVLAFVRRECAEREPIDVSVAVASLGALLQTLAGREVEVRLDLEVGAGVAVVERAALEQIVLNLVVNGRDAMPEGGVLTVRTRARVVDAPLAGAFGPIEPGCYVELAVTDTGTGIPEEIRARIFEPFFTTKPLGHGTGLGLSTVHDVLTAHGGSLELTTTEDVGSTFRVLLPAVEVDVPPRTSERARPADELRVLIIDRDDALRAAATRVLVHAGMSVREARTLDEARTIVTRERVHVVLCAIDEPPHCETELARALRTRRPELAVVRMKRRSTAVPPGREDLLEKPFSIDALVEAIRRAATRTHDGAGSEP